MRFLRIVIRPAAWLLVLLPALTVTAGAEDKAPSMVPVHVGVSVMAMGHFSDWATSWRQPELNPWLAEKTGPYTGQLYRAGTYRKAGTVAVFAGLSYLAAWRYPKARKWIGWISGGSGVAALGMAVSNVIRNPYYR